MKRFLSMLLCAAMLISFVPAAWAEGDGQELPAEQPVEEQVEQPVEEPYIPPVEEPSAPEEPAVTEPPVVEPTAEPEPSTEPEPTAEPEPAAEPEPEEPGFITFSGADYRDEALVYQYIVDTAAGETVTLAPAPVYDGVLTYVWLRYDAALGTYAEIDPAENPTANSPALTVTVAEGDIGAASLYACSVYAEDGAAGCAAFTFRQRAADTAGTDGVLVETITVTAPGDVNSVEVGETLQLSASVTPEDAENKVVLWTSSDEETATVDENGLVTGVADGVATIYAAAADDSGAVGEIELTVGNGVTLLTANGKKLSGTYEQMLTELKNYQNGKFWAMKKLEDQLIEEANAGLYSECVSGEKVCTGNSYGVDCKSNKFDGRVQCNGYTHYLGYILTGVKPNNWNNTKTIWNGEKYLNYADFVLEPGDIISYTIRDIYGGESQHWAVIWKNDGNVKDGSSLYIAECNYSDFCKVWFHKPTGWELEDITGKLRLVYKAPGNTGTSVTPSKPAATADMSVADYMNYYASAVSDYSAVATRKDASLKLWRLPWTCNSTVSYTTSTDSSFVITKRIVNHVNNIWYQLDNGSFIYSGDVNVKDTFKVSLDANGGTCSQTSKNVTGYNSAYGTLPTPTRTGYNFDGWYTAKSGGVRITASTKMTSRTDHTLYAHWTLARVSIAVPTISKQTSQTLLLATTISYSSSNKLKSWSLKYGTAKNAINKIGYEDNNISASILNKYNPLPVSVDFGTETPNLQPGTKYYYIITATAVNGETCTYSGEFTTLACTHSFDGNGVCTICGYNSRVLVTSVMLGVVEVELSPGKTYTPSWWIEPSNATDKTVSWTSSNTHVASVDSSGKVTANNAGTATITATANDKSGKTASFKVKVVEPVVNVQSLSLSCPETEFYPNETLTATVEVLPANASNKSVTWRSSDTDIATVDADGVITAVAPGTVEITATANDNESISDSLTLTVKSRYATKIDVFLKNKDDTLEVGDNSACFIYAEGVSDPENFDYEITLQNGTGEAVLAKHNFLYALRAGTVTLTIKALDGSNLSASRTFTLVEPAVSAEQALHNAIANGESSYVLSGNITLTQDLVIPNGMLLLVGTMAQDVPSVITVPQGVTVENYGRISVLGVDGGTATSTLILSGTLRNNGLITAETLGRIETTATARAIDDTHVYCYNGGTCASGVLTPDTLIPGAEMDVRISLAQQGKAYLTSSVTLRSDLYIPQDAELNIYEGESSATTLTVPAGVTVHNSGTVVVYGSADAELTAEMDVQGTFSNGGAMSVYRNGVVTVPGTFINSGYIEAYGGSRINLSGTYTNNGGSVYKYDDALLTGPGFDDVFRDDLYSHIADGDTWYELSTGITLTSDLVIPENFTLHVINGGRLTVPSGVTLTNNGQIIVYNESTVTVDAGGTFLNNFYAAAYGGKLALNGSYASGDNGSLVCWYGIGDFRTDITGVSTDAITLYAVSNDEALLRAAAAEASNVKNILMGLPSGASMTLTADLTIPENCELLLPFYEGDSGTLTIPESITLTNNGYIYVHSPAKLIIAGTLEHNGYSDIEDQAVIIENTGRITGESGGIWTFREVSTAEELYAALSSDVCDVNVMADIKIAKNVTIPEGLTVNVINGVTLTVNSGCTLTNDGNLCVRGNLIVKGRLAHNRAIVFAEGSITPATTPHYREGVLMEQIEIVGPSVIGLGCSAQYDIRTYPDNVWNTEMDITVLSGQDLATIDHETGILTAGNTAGTMVVRAEACDGSGVYTDFTLEIVDASLSVTGIDKLRTGQSGTVTATFVPENLTGTGIVWALAAGDEEYASVKAGKNNTATVTAKNVTEAHDVTVIASAADGSVADAWHVITVVPAAAGVAVTDENGAAVTAKEINLNAETELTLVASAVPAGAEGNIVWTSSDTKGAFGTYTDNGDGTLYVSLDPNAKLGTVTLTATDTVSRRKAAVKLTTTRVSTGVEITGMASAPSQVIPDDALVSGQSIQLKAQVLGSPKANSVIWSIPDEYAPYATVTAAGKLTAKAVTYPVEIEVVARAKDGASETSAYVWIVPKVNAVALKVNGEALSGTAYNVDLNGTADALTVEAVTFPADAKENIQWTVSDTKNVYAEYDVSGGSVSVYGFKGKTGSVTLTAKATDGSNKTARVTLKFVRYANSIEILNAPDVISGGKSVTLKTNVQTDKTLTDKAVVWSVSAASAPYASINASGSLKVQPAAVLVDIQVIATVKATGASTSCLITVTPNIAKRVDVLMNGEVVTGLTRTVDLTDAVSLSAEVQPTDEAVTWTSSSKAIAEVDANGTVTLKKAGTVTFTAATADKKTKATFKLTVVSRAQSISIVGGDRTVCGGGKLKLTAQLTPAKPTNSKVTWSIAPEYASYAGINSSGVLTAAKVTYTHKVVVSVVSNDDPAVRDEITVTISPAVNNMKVYADAPSVIDVGERDSVQLSVRSYPVEAMQDVTWKSSSANIASIDVDGTVTVCRDAKTGLPKTGTVTFTATAADGSRKSASIKLTFTRNMDTLTIVGADIIGGGKSVTYKAVCDQYATNKKVIWSLSGDTDCATLNASGVLKAKAVTAPKYVTVTATAADGGGATASIDVVIYPIVTKVNIFLGSEVVTGKTLAGSMSDLDELALRVENSPALSYKGWTVTTSNKDVAASIDPSGNISVSRVPGAVIKLNSVVTITVKATDGSNKTANVKLKLIDVN